MNRTLRNPPAGSPAAPHGHAFDATMVDPHPDAARVDFGDRNLLFAGDDSAPMPLDLALPVHADQPTVGYVGRYAVKERIGEGGLACVSAAWDPILSRDLAIKVLQLPGSSRAALDELILNEARAAAALSHPGIVTVFDAGRSEQGPYIAMERLAGCDLRHLLAEGWRPDAARAAKIVRRVADALAYAHDKGVVHCDVKPANIFMVDRRRPKLLDFGIARIAHGPGAAILRGLVTGSPHYLSPEQLAGQPADARSDLYALGVVFYELLTGVKPFGGDSLESIADAVAHHTVPAAHIANPAVPRALSRIVARAMARRPGDRYTDVRELAQTLRQWTARTEAESPPLAFAPVGARTSTAPEPRVEGAHLGRRETRKPGQRHLWRVGAAAVATLLMLAASAAWLWPGATTPTREAPARAAAANFPPG